MIFKEGYEIITPDEKCLADCVNLEEIICPIQGCGKVMCNTSAVRLHVSQSHGEKVEKCGSGKARLYACPMKGCPRNVEAARQQFFPILYSLKMHYRSVHGEKKFKCTKCSKWFGNHVVYMQHKYKCKQFYYCECGVWYTTRNALLVHAKRKQHKIIGLQGDGVNKPNKEPSGSPAAVTIPGILYLPNTQSHMNFKINHKVQSSMVTSDVPQETTPLPRLLRILPKAIQQGNSVFREGNDTGIFDMTLSEKKPVLCDAETILTDKHVDNGYSSIPYISTRSSSNTYIGSEPSSDLVLKRNTESKSTSPLPGNTVLENIHKKCMHSLPSNTLDQVIVTKCEHGNMLLSSEETPGISFGPAILHASIEKRKLKKSNVAKQTNQRKLFGYTYSKEKYLDPADHHSPNKSKDVFDEISVSAKNLANTFTQTSLSFKDIEDSYSLRKISMETQTQVNTSNFDKAPKKSTMDTQTQINYYNFNDSLKKSTMDTQTQIDTYNCNDIPKTSSMDTQTQINSSNFNDILKKLTMDTQTEINSYNFNDIPRKSMIDMQTQINKYDVNDIPRKSTMETQTQMNYNFDQYTTEVLGTSDFGIQCHMETYCIDECFRNNLFPVIDNETQTETVSSWLSNFTCQDLSNMETQTNFPECNDSMQTNFNVEPLVFDKSVQLEDMISLNDTCDIILTESSNMSTQTVDVLRDPWLNENLSCESSSTQTDYFENLDFVDIDFHLEKENSLSDNITGYCNDTLIPGNIANENTTQIKNNIETQTTISLYDLLDSSLIGNYINMDKNMANNETQTSGEFDEIHGRPTTNIEMQTGYFV